MYYIQELITKYENRISSLEAQIKAMQLGQRKNGGVVNYVIKSGSKSS